MSEARAEMRFNPLGHLPPEGDVYGATPEDALRYAEELMRDYDLNWHNEPWFVADTTDGRPWRVRVKRR